MFRTVILALPVVAILAGCGITETSEDANTYVETLTDALNCDNDTASTNDYGCYDSGVLFPGASGEKVTKNVWSVYTRSDQTLDTVFYDRYLRGYEFGTDGYAYKQEAGEGYNAFGDWGIDDAGTSISVYNDGSYTYAATFTGQDGCYEVSSSAGTVKFCHEAYVDQSLQNSTGYYGADLRFGNLINYDYKVVGTWTIAGYGSNDTAQTSVTLNADGTTSNGGEWGLGADGKAIGIDGTRYFVYQYLKKGDCIVTLEVLSSGLASSTQWKLCKQ